MGLCNSLTKRDNRSEVALDMFVFQSELGRGGFAKVLCGIFLHTGEWLAVKIVNKYDYSTRKAGKQLLFSELEALKRLANRKHPFIVNLHFAFQDRGNCYFALDLKRGGNLRYHLDLHHADSSTFSERDVCIFVLCLTSALDFIHGKKIIHRDVKPENIILDSFGRPCLTDFGVTHVGNENETYSLVSTLRSGTTAYLAPEVYLVHPHGPQCDYWSLGIVAYEMLYGKRPFGKSERCPGHFILYVEGLAQQKRLSPSGLSGDTRPFTSVTKGVKRNQEDLVIDAKSKSLKSSALSSPDSIKQEPTEIVDMPDTLAACDVATAPTSHTDSSDSEQLQDHLKIPLNKRITTSRGLVEISDSCLDVLQGLLDIRPSYRYGYLNLDILIGHHWFKSNNLQYDLITNDDNIIRPSYQPGSIYTRQMCMDHQLLAYEDAVTETSNAPREIKQSFPNVSLFQSTIFRDFYFKGYEF